MITCTVCPLQFNEINDLASHMEKDHKNKINQSHDINYGPPFKCNRCASNFTTTTKNSKPTSKNNIKAISPVIILKKIGVN